MIQATIDEENIVQPTLIARTGGQSGATAFLIIPRGEFSSLSFARFSLDDGSMDIDVTCMAEDPDPQTAPIDLTITYALTGTSVHWASDDAPTPLTFTTLEADAEEARAAGTFTGFLCYAEDYDSSVDTDNCHPIEGSFDTVFLVE